MERFKVGTLRVLTRAMVAANWWRARPSGVQVDDVSLQVDGGRIVLRCYRPGGDKPFPLLLFFHGGGWVSGDIGTHDALCRGLCLASGHLVVSVDYRLAPERRFPTAFLDCRAALDWLHEQAPLLGGDPTRIRICGDSAGGNLAAAIVIDAQRRRPGGIDRQVLIYPVADQPDSSRPSYVAYGGRGHALSGDAMQWLWRTYLGDRDLPEPGTPEHDWLMPLRVDDLQGLPPALILLAELDVLRDEGQAYADRLCAAGVATQIKLHPGQQHGFVGLKPSPAHRQAVAQIADWLCCETAS
nr:alpha/beta hydrolase [Solimonas marina]